MLSKAETKEITKLFWTSYGKYMQKHVPLFHPKTKWTNYKTRVKDIYFRLKANKKEAEIAIEIQHKNIEIQELFYEQFEELRNLYTSTVGEWVWEKLTFNEYGVQISKIYLTKKNVNIFDQNTWIEIFQFFEKHEILFDEFWSEFGDIFIDLDR